MKTGQWRLHEAKAHLSQLVDAALQGEHQHITRRGKRAVVMLSETEYERLVGSAKMAAPSFVEHLLSMPRDDGEFDRTALSMRDVGFE